MTKHQYVSELLEILSREKVKLPDSFVTDLHVSYYDIKISMENNVSSGLCQQEKTKKGTYFSTSTKIAEK